jgi:MFS family permease
MTDDRLFTRPFLLLVVAHFLQALGYSSMLTLPLYLDWLGATRTEIGLAMAVAAFGSLATRPLVGWALDTIGRRPVLVAGTVTLVAGMLGVGLIESMSWLVYAVRVVVGLGVGVLFAAYFTMAADLIPARRRTEGLALFGISGLLPLLLNPFAEGLVPDPSGLRWFFPGVGGFIAISLLVLPLIPDPPTSRQPDRAGLGDAWAALTRTPLAPVWTATCVFAGMVAVFMAFVMVAAEARGIGSPAAVWVTYCLGAVGVRAFGAKLPDRIGGNPVLFGALLAYTAGFVGIALAESTLGFVAAGLVTGFGHGFAFPVIGSQVVSRAPDHLRGYAVSTFTGAWEVAGLVLTPVFGGLADARGDQQMLLLAAAFGLLGLTSWAGLERRFGADEP